MTQLYHKIRRRVRKLSILAKFTLIITLVFLLCFMALTILAEPIATNLSIEYAHRSMTQRLKSLREQGFSDSELTEAYAHLLVQNGEYLSIINTTTSAEVLSVNEIENFEPNLHLMNFTNQRVIRVETTATGPDQTEYQIIMYANIAATIEPFLNAYYRYIIPLISTIGLLLTLAGVFTVMYLTRRIQTFTQKMQLIRENGYQEELPSVYTEDEVGEMIRVFNEMIAHFQEMHEAQKQFVSDASHELKTPLAIIEGNAQLIEKWGTKDPAILEESIPALRRGVERAKMLIDDLLVLSRTRVVEGEPIHDIELRDIIENYVHDLQIIYPDVEFNFQLEAVTYPMIAVDFAKLINIFVENGIKYSAENPRITIALHELGTGFELRIQDSGIGISPEHQQRIFERFYRIDLSRSRDTGGNGIGLAVAKKIVDKYKGKIFVESEIGEGSTFVTQFDREK
ncbi:MAG: sensor histidine kinase [Culicoidibacterales bacterium]